MHIGGVPMIEIVIDRELEIPLYIQIKNAIESAIGSGDLNGGDRLPPVATLAKRIGVTQATVRRALKDLQDAGLTSCHVGRGTFILESGAAEAAVSENESGRHGNGEESHSRSYVYAARRLRTGVGKALGEIMGLADRPGLIHLMKGVPDPSLLPENLLADASMETLAGDASSFIEATDPLGSYELRVEVARNQSQAGMMVSPDQVLITNGSIQAVTLMAQINCELNYKVFCETPCFKGITDTFGAMGHWVETVARDGSDGRISPENNGDMEKKGMLYICPYSNNPTGIDLPDNRRAAIVQWAQHTGSLVIADEIFRDLNFSNPLKPSIMRDLGPDQCVVVGSLSKSLMTGLRVGWMISSPQRIAQLSQLKKLMDHACPSLVQGVATTIFRSGRYDDHVQKMRTLYQKRSEVMLEALSRYMVKEVSWSRPEGGFSLMLELPPGYSSIGLFVSAIEKGVSFLPGPLFDIDQRFVHCCRLSYAWADESEIREGVELLAEAVGDLLSRPAGEWGLSGIGSYH